jgi:hypothetical protein
MFKLVPPLFLVVPVVWLTILVLSLLNVVTPALQSLGVRTSTSWVVMVVQAVLAAAFLTPLWRVVWRAVPSINQWWFPDLTGTWTVTVASNYDRIDATLRAAASRAERLDMRALPETSLPPLSETVLTAEITQSWAGFSITMWNPLGDTPIKWSRTLAVEPVREKDGRRGLAYVFEQENNEDPTSDERVFKGAAWIERDRHDPDLLCGRMWSDRMWKRGMNTAANLKFVRVSRAAPTRRESVKVQ